MLNNALLALRPTNVMHQLGADNPIPLYSGRSLLQSLANSTRILWMPQLPHAQAALGVFRAAVHRRSLVALSLDLSDQETKGLRQQTRPAGFVSSAIGAAEQLEEAPPFALHLQTPAIFNEQSEIQGLRDLCADCVQAGFTSFGLDLSNIAPEAVSHAAQILNEPIATLELALTLTLPMPQGEGDHPTEQIASHICQLVESLHTAQVYPDLVRLPHQPDSTEQAWQLAHQLASQLPTTPLAFKEYNPAQARQPNPAQANIRAIVSDPLLLRTWPGGPEPTDDPDRTEALAYSASLKHLDRLGSQNSLADFVQYLVNQCG